MEERVARMARHRVSHFILGEEGKVGSKSAFVAGAVIGVSSFAAMLLGTAQKVRADSYCGDVWCGPNEWCCYWPDAYHCVGRPIPGYDCWIA